MKLDAGAHARHGSFEAVQVVQSPGFRSPVTVRRVRRSRRLSRASASQRLARESVGAVYETSEVNMQQ